MSRDDPDYVNDTCYVPSSDLTARLVARAVEAAVAAERAHWRAWIDRRQKVQEYLIDDDCDPAPDKRR